MKGFTLKINGECISGSIEDGITSVLVTYKDGLFRVFFSSLDKSGMLAYTWYASELKIGDCIRVCFEDITRLSEAREIRNYNKMLEQSQKETLETYRTLKEELIEEGLI